VVQSIAGLDMGGKTSRGKKKHAGTAKRFLPHVPDGSRNGRIKKKHIDGKKKGEQTANQRARGEGQGMLTGNQSNSLGGKKKKNRKEEARTAKSTAARADKEGGKDAKTPRPVSPTKKNGGGTYLGKTTPEKKTWP